MEKSNPDDFAHYSPEQTLLVLNKLEELTRENVQTAKFIIGGVAGLLFFVANFVSGLIDKTEYFGVIEKVSVCICLASGAISILFCLQNFWVQNQFLRISGPLGAAISNNDARLSAFWSEKLGELKRNHLDKQPYDRALGSSMITVVLCLITFALVIF